MSSATAIGSVGVGKPVAQPAFSPVAAAAPAPGTAPVASGPTAAAQNAAGLFGNVRIWQFKGGQEVPMMPDELNEGGDQVARVALANAHKVEDFFKTRFNRNGWDNAGSPLQIVVHAPADDGGRMNNAYWDRERGKIYIGDGDGKIFSPLGGALDVMTHETVHAVVDSEVNLPYRGQQGGINESWADVLGALADPDHDWLIGEDVFTPSQPGDAIRDLANPRFSSLTQIPKGADVEVHDLSGIPSLAAVKVADKIGRDQMGEIWYHALCDHLDSRAGFSGAARATLDAAVDLFGKDSTQFAAVRDAWKAVGVNARYKQ